MKTFGLVLFLFLLVNTSFGQGWYWEGITNGVNTKNYAMPKMLKSVEGTKEENIIRFDKKHIITINHSKKTYTVMTFEELEKMLKGANSAMAEMAEQLKNMPEEQRKMVEEMMKKNLPSGEEKNDYHVQKTKDVETISGYKCVKYVVTKDKEEYLTIWATTDIKGIESLKNDMTEYYQKIESLTPQFGKAISEGMKSVEGFPIKTVGMKYSSLVTKVEKHNSAPSEFEVPKGYTKVKAD